MFVTPFLRRAFIAEGGGSIGLDAVAFGNIYYIFRLLHGHLLVQHREESGKRGKAAVEAHLVFIMHRDREIDSLGNVAVGEVVVHQARTVSHGKEVPFPELDRFGRTGLHRPAKAHEFTETVTKQHQLARIHSVL